MAFLTFRGNSTSPTKPSSTTAANAPLTNVQIDGNFASLNDSKIETSDATSTNTASKVVIRDASGNFSAGIISANQFQSLSDENRKKNIHTITGATDTIAQLRGVEFEWKDTSAKSAGVIAQELEKILPHLIETSEDNTKTVNYLGLIGYLIQSNKELADRVSALEARA